MQLNLVNKSYEADLSNYVESGEWELKRITVVRNVRVYPCCPEEPFPDVIFYIYIRRRILYYLINILIPCILLSIISVMTFWLPPDSGEKVTLSITVLLAYSVFMLLIAENIPATSEMVPLIGIYLTITMTLTSMSIVLTVFVLQLHHATQYAPRIPRDIYYIFTRIIAYAVGMKSVVLRFESSQRKLEAKSQIRKSVHYDTNDRFIKVESINQVKELNVTHELRNETAAVTASLNDVNSNQIFSNFHLTTTERNRDSIPFIDGEELSSSGVETREVCSRCKRARLTSDVNERGFEGLKNFLAKLHDISSQAEDANDDVIMIKNEWKIIALIVDRVLFCVFSLLTFVSSVLLLVVLPLLKNASFINEMDAQKIRI